MDTSKGFSLPVALVYGTEKFAALSLSLKTSSMHL